MEEIVCEICVKDYNDDEIVPRVLLCGHTICSLCITQIMQTSGCCPKCRKVISCSSSNDYPVNYSLLRMVDSLKSDTTLPTFLHRHLNVLKRKYVTMETKFTEAVAILENNLDLITTSLTRIQELKDDKSIDVDTCNKTIMTLNQQLEELRSVRTLNFAKLKSSTTLNYCDFNGPTAFIQEIYKQASNQKIFYAVSKINDEVKFSRISVWGNKLILHAFGPPIEDSQICTVLFQEIKNCLRTDNVRALLEVSCNAEGIRHMIVIKTINSSLVPQFLKLCTGEMGPAYKGATYRQGTASHINITYASSVLEIDGVFNGDKGNENLEYISSLGTIATYTVNDLVVIGKSDGSIQIVHLTNAVNITDAIGKVEEPFNLHQFITHGIDRKITDSGITIQL